MRRCGATVVDLPGSARPGSGVADAAGRHRRSRPSLSAGKTGTRPAAVDRSRPSGHSRSTSTAASQHDDRRRDWLRKRSDAPQHCALQSSDLLAGGVPGSCRRWTVGRSPVRGRPHRRPLRTTVTGREQVLLALSRLGRCRARVGGLVGGTGGGEACSS